MQRAMSNDPPFHSLRWVFLRFFKTVANHAKPISDFLSWMNTCHNWILSVEGASKPSNLCAGVAIALSAAWTYEEWWTWHVFSAMLASRRGVVKLGSSGFSLGWFLHEKNTLGIEVFCEKTKSTFRKYPASGHATHCNMQQWTDSTIHLQWNLWFDSTFHLLSSCNKL